MVAKRGLGKGLDSMIPDKLEMESKENKNNTENVSRETLVNLNEIEPNKGQPRKAFNEDALHELSESIKQFGVIQPLIVQKREKYYELIAGERRWRAAKLAGLKKVPVIIKEYSSQEVMEIALIENIQREDLNPIEEAIAYQKLIAEYSLKQDEVADRVSKSRTAITNALRLLKLDQKVQQMLIEDMLSSGHARALIPLNNNEIQHQVALKIFDEKLSVRETENLVKKLLTETEKSKKNTINVINNEQEKIVYQNLEEKLKRIIGTNVSINKKSNSKGKIEIEYYSNEELERIIEIFDSIQDI